MWNAGYATLKYGTGNKSLEIFKKNYFVESLVYCIVNS